MKEQHSHGKCPIAGAEIGPACSITGCMHNRAGSCGFVHSLSLEGDLTATSQEYSVSIEAIQARILDIQCALVSARWFEHLNQKPLNEGKASDFRAASDPKQAAEFAEWNTSSFTFADVLKSLNILSLRL